MSGTVSQTTVPAKPLRADAARNRTLILAAARVVFAERGLDASLDDVASRAGVGVGTLYRRFADRDELIEAVFEERISEQVAHARLAVEVPDAWEGLVTLLRRTCGELATDRGLRQFFLGAARGRACMTRGRELLYPLTAELVERAKAQGSLSDTFEPTDVPLLLLMMSTVGDFAGDIAPDLWQRYFDLYIAGIRAPTEGTSRALTPPLALVQLDQATSAWHPSYR